MYTRKEIDTELYDMKNGHHGRRTRVPPTDISL